MVTTEEARTTEVTMAFAFADALCGVVKTIELALPTPVERVMVYTLVVATAAQVAL